MISLGATPFVILSENPNFRIGHRIAKVEDKIVGACNIPNEFSRQVNRCTPDYHVLIYSLSESRSIDTILVLRNDPYGHYTEFAGPVEVDSGLFAGILRPGKYSPETTRACSCVRTGSILPDLILDSLEYLRPEYDFFETQIAFFKPGETSFFTPPVTWVQGRMRLYERSSQTGNFLTYFHAENHLRYMDGSFNAIGEIVWPSEWNKDELPIQLLEDDNGGFWVVSRTKDLTNLYIRRLDQEGNWVNI